MKKIYLFIVMMGIVARLLVQNLCACPGCMDTSLHAYACNDGEELCSERHYDNKKVHYVNCSCPCEQYQIYQKRGSCSFCNHYHDPEDNLESNVSSFQYGNKLFEKCVEQYKYRREKK